MEKALCFTPHLKYPFSLFFSSQALKGWYFPTAHAKTRSGPQKALVQSLMLEGRAAQSPQGPHTHTEPRDTLGVSSLLWDASSFSLTGKGTRSLCITTVC